MSDTRLFNSRVRWTSLGLMLVVGVIVGMGILQYCSAEITAPTAMDRDVTRMVTRLMRSSHLSRRPVDDEISRRGFHLFVKSLDPWKSYFYQSDLDDFKAYEDQLDDMLARYDTRFAQLVFQRFLQRVDERLATIDALLKQEHDFTLDEEMITDPDLLQYPRDEKEAHERWRQRIKYDLLLLTGEKSAGRKSDAPKSDAPKSDGQESPKSEDPAQVEKDKRERLSNRYHNFARRMKQFDNEELLETFLTAITAAFDPHTAYMSPTTLENFSIALRLNLEGIGAQLQDKDGKIIVADIVPGGAASKHGRLKKDDQIITVGQGPDGNMVDIVGMKLNDVVKLIRGKAGTVVRLGIVLAGTKESEVYEITRAKIELEDSAAHGEVFEVGSNADGSPLKVGVIDLPSFYQDMEGRRRRQQNFKSATRDVERILGEFRNERVDAVVLDLRGNGGGSLDEAVELTGLFIDQGPVVQVMDFDKHVKQHLDNTPGTAWDGPLVVITNKLSASASEILAGAVQDYRRGLVVGDQATHGKGTVQSLQDLAEAYDIPFPPKLGALKITVQQFFRPNGDSTQKRGVLSDIMLPSITNYMDIAEGDLDYALDFQRIERGTFAAQRMVTGQLMADLRARSGQRVSQSEDFAKLLKRIEAYQLYKARKSVTLNERKFFEEDEMPGELEEEDRLAEEIKDKKKIKRDFYLDEVLAIARDYVNALRQENVAQVD